jgi:hypothetical protein
VVVQFGGCDGKVVNCLPMMRDWNYAVLVHMRKSWTEYRANDLVQQSTRQDPRKKWAKVIRAANIRVE